MELLSTSFLIIRKDFFNQAKYYPPLSFGRCPDAIRHRLVGELIVLPDQRVGAIVLVGDGSRTLSDRGYVPVVVVRVFVSVIAAVLVGREQRRLGTVIPRHVGQVGIVVAGKPQPPFRDPANGVVVHRQNLPVGESGRHGFLLITFSPNR